MGNKYIWIFGIFAVGLVLIGGGGYWKFFVDDQDPKFHAVSVDPTDFRFKGGRLQVQTEVSDDVSVDQVSGVLWRGASQIALVAMTRSDVGVKGLIYSAEFTVPANVRSTGQPVEYTLQFLVSDSVGQVSKKEVGFEVPAPGVPPAPPQLQSAD